MKNKDKRTELLVLREKYKQQLIKHTGHTTDEIVGMAKTAALATSGVWIGFKILNLFVGKKKNNRKSTQNQTVSSSKNKRNGFFKEITSTFAGSIFFELKEFFYTLLRQMVMDFVQGKMYEYNQKMNNPKNNQENERTQQ